MRMRERKLDGDEFEEMLAKNMVGTLSLCNDGVPYAVQLEYLYQNGNIYFATYLEGRKVDILKKNNRAVFTVFEDRHTHPDMIKQKVRCHALMVEGTVETILVKEVTNHKGAVLPFRLLKFNIADRGSWQCDRKRCNVAAGSDDWDAIRGWIAEAEQGIN